MSVRGWCRAVSITGRTCRARRRGQRMGVGMQRRVPGRVVGSVSHVAYAGEARRKKLRRMHALVPFKLDFAEYGSHCSRTLGSNRLRKRHVKELTSSSCPSNEAESLKSPMRTSSHFRKVCAVKVGYRQARRSRHDTRPPQRKKSRDRSLDLGYSSKVGYVFGAGSPRGWLVVGCPRALQ